MKIIEQLEAWGIPTDYDVKAVQAIRNHDPSSGLLWTEELSKEQKEERIALILGIDQITFENDKHARLVYGYAVGETVKAGGQVDAQDILNRVAKTIDDMPWVVKEYEAFSHADEGPPKLDAVGNVKQKKGAKKALAIEVYNREKGTERSRKEWIELLMSEVGLSKAGASTYYAGLKKGTMV